MVLSLSIVVLPLVGAERARAEVRTIPGNVPIRLATLKTDVTFSAIPANADKMKATEPMSDVSAKTRPILLIHGTADTTVSIHDSEAMYAAMTQAWRSDLHQGCSPTSLRETCRSASVSVVEPALETGRLD